MPLLTSVPDSLRRAARGLSRDQRRDAQALWQALGELRSQLHAAYRESGRAFQETFQGLQTRLSETLATDAPPPRAEPWRTLHDLARRYALPKSRFLTLLDGLNQELFQRRLRDARQLEALLLQTGAQPAALLASILSVDADRHRAALNALGQGCRLTGMLLSVPEALDDGRLWLPQSEQAECGVNEADFDARQPTEAMRELFSIQTERARRLLTQGEAALPQATPDAAERAFAEAILADRHARLDALEAAGWNPFDATLRIDQPSQMGIRKWMRGVFGRR